MMAHDRERDGLRASRRRRVLAVAAALMFPSLLTAQQPEGQPAIHQVREGDTLWDIARMYLGDPFLWPEIYRLNTDIVEDPHWIFPGEVLRLPGATPFQIAQQTPTVPGDTAAPAPQPSGEIVAPDEPAPISTGPTIFTQRSRRLGTVQNIVRTDIVGRMEAPSIRPGEIIAAPWIDREGGPRDGGVVVQTSEQSIIVPAASKYPIPPYENILVQPPNGIVPERGERYLIVQRGPMLDYVGQLMIPTGVVEITEPRTGEASTGRVVQQFEEIRGGQLLLPLTTLPTVTGTAKATPVATGPQAKVVWIMGDVQLPSLQRYLILDATDRDGVRLGDQFTLMKRATREGDTRLPSEDLAVTQVVRVTPFATTVIVIGQSDPAITEGTPARVTARLP